MSSIIQYILDLWAKSTAYKTPIARHLARIALYELKGSEALYPNVKEKYELLESKMNSLGKPIWFVEGFRSAEKQDGYYAKGRTKSGSIITNAKGLQSYHQYGLAFDIAFKDYNWKPPSSDWWKVVGEEGEKLGLIWGGSFQDWGHFEFHEGFTWKDLIKYFNG